jgi:putative membrane protein insertion efficiency factor
VAGATTHKESRVVTSAGKAPVFLGLLARLKPCPTKADVVGRRAASVAGNSVGARNVLEMDDLRTMNSRTTGQGSAARWLLLLFVRFYQIFFSPFLGGACKFYPSCSCYAQEAIAMHGARRGAWLAMKRLGRCRPFTKGGFDPVPEVMREQELGAEAVGSKDGGERRTSAAEATTHKPTTRHTSDYSDAEWLRSARKEPAQ